MYGCFDLTISPGQTQTLVVKKFSDGQSRQITALTGGTKRPPISQGLYYFRYFKHCINMLQNILKTSIQNLSIYPEEKRKAKSYLRNASATFLSVQNLFCGLIYQSTNFQ